MSFYKKEPEIKTFNCPSCSKKHKQTKNGEYCNNTCFYQSVEQRRMRGEI